MKDVNGHQWNGQPADLCPEPADRLTVPDPAEVLVPPQRSARPVAGVHTSSLADWLGFVNRLWFGSCQSALPLPSGSPCPVPPAAASDPATVQGRGADQQGVGRP